VEQGPAVSTIEFSRAFNWADSDLGPRELWPASVEQVIAALFESPVPVCYQHGPRFVMVYNDAFAELLGAKHPAAFGQPAPEVVAEVWDQPNVGRAFEEVLRTGTPFLDEGTELRLARGRGSSGVDVGYFLRAGSAIRDETGTVVGVLHVAIERTEGVRRVQAVADLASDLAVAVTVDDVSKVALRHAMSGLPAREIFICLPLPTQSTGWRVTMRAAGEVPSAEEERLPLVWADLEGGLLGPVEKMAGTGRPYVAESDDLVMFPMQVGRRLGAVGVRLAGAHLGAELMALVATTVELVGQAMERAQLYDTQRSTAELFQRMLLPQSLPQSGTLALAARYEPAVRGTLPGGDFYDAFTLEDGRMALVIGDVVGRGVMAATVMGQIRAAARGAALSRADPSSVLASVDRVVAGLDALQPVSVPVGGYPDRRAPGYVGELFVTMLYGVLDPDSGRLLLASAGHLAPALLTRFRSGPKANSQGDSPYRAELVDMEAGPPLGVGGDRPVHTMELKVGDLLLAYTDGLLERRNRSIMEGEDHLLRVLSEVAGESPRTVCQQVLEGMVTASGFEDDCALLAVARTPVEHRRATLVVPPLPEAVKPARDWARGQLADWEVPVEQEFSVVTGLSELVTNAVLHAATDAHVTLDLDDHRVTVTVTDTGSVGAPSPGSGDLISARGRGLGLVRSISDAFGTHRTATGSTVWFEVALETSSEFASAGR
jgi:serine phosphatase RsbU (regulator of sigma subunit)/anti-sigma regulatory factor (Ser/Thr protein kinase)